MKLHLLTNLFVICSFILSLFYNPSPAKAQTEAPDPGDYIPGELVIGYKTGLKIGEYGVMANSTASTAGMKAKKVNANGVALFKANDNQNLKNLIEKVKQDPNVEFVELNYVYKLPDIEKIDTSKVNKDVVIRKTPKGLDKQTNKEFVGITKEALSSMKSIVKGKVQATYPKDPYLWDNNGWSTVGADIVWQNTTPSAGVCVIDTGVDALHPDLAGRIINGYDFVNNDSLPADDHGHGTHVAGIITAIGNNGKGIMGGSTAKVVAVKVLTAQGWGTNYDIAAGINFCGNRSDVKIISMSLGGTEGSNAIYNALNFAVNTRGKLAIIAAGNADTDVPHYPAYYATESIFENKVMAVAASGAYYEDPPGSDEWYLENWCRADYSNYGDWVSLIAPGTDILSTTPYDKPFYMNYFDEVDTRYAYLSGTSMATPLVAAAAARRWGFKPTETNQQIGTDLLDYGSYVDTDDSCWPSSMGDARMVNTAALLERGALSTSVRDASTGLPLNGASVGVYKGTALAGTGVVTPYTEKYYWDADPTRIYTYYSSGVDIINLPAGYEYTPKLTKTGYTNGGQNAWQHGFSYVDYGYYNYIGAAAAPPQSTNIDSVLGWWTVYNDSFVNYPDYDDLDMNVWLPDTPNPLDSSQIAPFIVGFEGDSYGYLEDDSVGSMNVFPFARYKREGGWSDYVLVENTTISSRKAHAPLVANPALPYYPGEYVFQATDFGETIDHDGDPGTDEIPLMGAYEWPFMYIWKDGKIKLFVQMDWVEPGDPCNATNWIAASIQSGISGSITYTAINQCGDETIVPYGVFDKGNPYARYGK